MISAIIDFVSAMETALCGVTVQAGICVADLFDDWAKQLFTSIADTIMMIRNFIRKFLLPVISLFEEGKTSGKLSINFL
jgi:hypothetical protein